MEPQQHHPFESSLRVIQETKKQQDLKIVELNSKVCKLENVNQHLQAELENLKRQMSCVEMSLARSKKFSPESSEHMSQHDNMYLKKSEHIPRARGEQQRGHGGEPWY